MVLPDRRAVSDSRRHRSLRRHLSMPRRPPGAVAIPGRRGLRQRHAGLSRCARQDFRATTDAAAPRRTAIRSMKSSGKCIASRHPEHRPGDRVVGWASAFDGSDGTCRDRRRPGGALRSGADSRHRPSACNRWPVCSTPSSSCPTSTVGMSASSARAPSGCCSRVRPKRRAPGTSPASTRSTAPSIAEKVRRRHHACGPPATGGSVSWLAMTGRTS